MPLDASVTAEVDRLAKTYADELVAFRRDLHAHPEPGREEYRTTTLVADRLAALGLEPTRLPTGTGLLCDIGPTASPGRGRGRIALRADLDALRIADEKDVPYRSNRPGVCHACGHDVHTAIVLGAGIVLAELAGQGMVDHGVRLIFQPAEEVIPGGALDVMAAGGLEGVEQIFGVHCDPRLNVGEVGLRTGALTSAADRVHIRLSGPGGHTARPHLTADLVHALATLVSQLPSALSRRVDPRAGLTLVWGRVNAGATANAIPMEGEAEGTLRCLDAGAWASASELVPALAKEIVTPFGVSVQAEVHRGVPPVVNDPLAVSVMQDAAECMLGPGAIAPTDQSLGGEDFAWYLTKVRGAMARIGVRSPGNDRVFDLHQGTFDVDEHAISVGVRLLAATALLAGAEPERRTRPELV
ncbi:MAG TPA: amidohydrolase [Actinopolymorphaceae bacterium]|jgi:amidohydrolase